MNDEWKEIIQKAMQEEAEMIMEEVNADPTLRDVKCPEEVHDRLFAQICEYEEQKRLKQLTEEERELIRLGKVYKKRRKWSRYAVLVAALITVLALGTVSIGEGDSILRILSRYLLGGEQVVSDSGSIEPIHYEEEQRVFEKIEDTYNFSPVKLEYLPQDLYFQEAVFYDDLQKINLYYGEEDEANIVYIIKPYYRESSYAILVEDQVVQDYVKTVYNTNVSIKEYLVEESQEKRWVVTWEYKGVQYSLNITNVEQIEIDKIIENLKLYE